MSDKSIRERIIETSMRLFEAHGYHRVTVDQIVKESGTSKGGFYHNFKTKDELLYIIHDQFISYVLEKAQDACQQWETPPERLQAIVKSFVMMIDLYRSQVTIFYQESLFLAPEYFSEIEKKRDQYKQIMFSVIQEGIDTGDFRPELPVPIVSMAIFGMVNWIYKWYQKTGTYSIEQIADIYADMVLHSTLQPGAMNNPMFTRFFLQQHDSTSKPQ
jgi:TetR/AcrR family transcriptional regulator, cholesterol catabolism regulator